MVKRKKKAWNNTNPLYRYLHGGKKAKPKKPLRVKRKRAKGALSMVRHRKSHKRSFGGGSGSLIKTALIGIGTAEFANFIPVNIPFKEEAAGAAGAYLVGGKNVKSALVGAGAVYLKKMVMGQTSTTNTLGGVY